MIKLAAGIAITVKNTQAPIWYFLGDKVEVKTQEGFLIMTISDKDFRALLTAYCNSNPQPYTNPQ
jgi:hypothetical protein